MRKILYFDVIKTASFTCNTVIITGSEIKSQANTTYTPVV